MQAHVAVTVVCTALPSRLIVTRLLLFGSTGTKARQRAFSSSRNAATTPTN